MNLSSFNEAQRKAIELSISHDVIPEVLILAGAGSGKTRVLTYRIAYLIENGVNPKNILALTFTKKAANEMKERCFQITPNAKFVTLSTFHSLCADILRKLTTGKFDILDDSDQRALIKTIAKESVTQTIDAKAFMEWMSYQRAKCLDLTAASSRDSEEIKGYRLLYREFELRKKQMKALDFDDLLEKVVALLKSREDIKLYLQNMWRYILVDEYQDTNKRQAQLLDLLKGKNTQFLQVGDEDQLIYSWRGAEIEHILSAHHKAQQNHGVTCIPLLTNYRCDKNILTLANAVVSSNISRTGKELNPHLPAARPVKICSYSYDAEESDSIVSQIRRWFNEGVSWKNIAVLIRVNRLSRALERALIERRVPYKIHNGLALFDTKEIRSMMNLMAFCSKPDETFYLQQSLDVIKLGVGPATIKSMSKSLNENANWLDLLLIQSKKKQDKKITKFVICCQKAQKLISQGDLSGAAENLMLNSMLLDAFKEEEQESRGENLLLFISILQDYEREKIGTGNLPSLSDFQEKRLLDDTLIDKDEGDSVQIMSVHKSKGLEFECGVILGMQDGVFPMKETSPDRDNEEDVRLAYVAITRFKKELMITRSERRAGFNDLSPLSSITGPHESNLQKKGVLKIYESNQF